MKDLAPTGHANAGLRRITDTGVVVGGWALGMSTEALEALASEAPEYLRPYVELADAYARRLVDPKNRGTVGKWMRLAGERYFRDREQALEPGALWTFDEEQAQRPCQFVEQYLTHVEGEWGTAKIVLHDSDVFFLVNLFGFRKRDGHRRYTSALKAVARKNAKSTIAAAIGLYCLTSEGERGAEVITAATTGSQARIIFRIAQRMVEASRELRAKFKIDSFANHIACYSNGGQFRPINSKASTQDGLNPSCCLLDEIHAHKNHDLVNVLRSAAGARANSLFLFTTTEGYESPGPWPELRQFAKQILEQAVVADHFLVSYHALDDEQGRRGERGHIPADDEFDAAKWIKANPLLDVNPILRQEIEREATEARRMPGRLAEFRIKRLNRPSASAGAWINLLQWRKCASPRLDLDKIGAARCWGGLDLSSNRDIASFRLVWEVDGITLTHGWRFVPKNQVHARTDRGLVPYLGWRDAGYLTESGDEVIDYDDIERCVIAAKQRFNLQSVAYDAWNAGQLVAKLTDLKVPMEMFIQGPKSFHPAMRELERIYAEGKLQHENDPVLNWCAGNLVVRYDVNLNMAPEKKGAPDKIDDMVALLMAIGQKVKSPVRGGVYQMFSVG